MCFGCIFKLSTFESVPPAAQCRFRTPQTCPLQMGSTPPRRKITLYFHRSIWSEKNWSIWCWLSDGIENKESLTSSHNLQYNLLVFHVYSFSAVAGNINTTVLVTKIYIKDINCEDTTKGSFPGGFLIVFPSETDVTMLMRVFMQ